MGPTDLLTSCLTDSKEDSISLRQTSGLDSVLEVSTGPFEAILGGRFDDVMAIIEIKRVQKSLKPVGIAKNFPTKAASTDKVIARLLRPRRWNSHWQVSQ
jgi:hypothetical protein